MTPAFASCVMLREAGINGGNVTQDRAARVAEEWTDHPNKNLEGTYTTIVNGREIRITKVEYGSDGDLSWVDIWVGNPNGRPAMRICNPPTLVPDPNGDVEVELRGTKRMFREDPVEAVARSVAAVRGVE